MVGRRTPTDPTVRITMPTLVVGALLVVSLVISGSLWAQMQWPDADSRGLSAGSDRASAWIPDAGGTSAALRVFQRAQTIDDVFPVSLPKPYDPRSVRLLTEARSGASFKVFGALANPDLVCLTVVFRDFSTSGSCTSAEDFERGGVSVATHAHRVTTDDGSRYVTNQLTWMPDGRVAGTTEEGG